MSDEPKWARGGRKMAKFRKKPVVIEAVQVPISGDMENWGRLSVFLGTGDYWQVRNRGRNLEIRTLEGKMLANNGDWIIKGVAGEFYVCKPDIFAATYEQVSED